MPPNRLRIIAGCWRGRRIGFPALAALRPTPDRVRETVFNWLQSEIDGAHCLDLFAGTGILGFEALSRGAASVTCVEREPAAVTAIRRNAGALDAGGMSVVQNDAMDFLKRSQPRPMDIVFIDPPYGSPSLGPVCRLLEERTWLAPRASIYVETRALNPALAAPADWQCLRSKRAGQVDYRLYCRSREGDQR